MRTGERKGLDEDSRARVPSNPQGSERLKHRSLRTGGSSPAGTGRGATRSRESLTQGSLRPSLRPRSPASPSGPAGSFVPAPRPPLRAPGPASSATAIGRPSRQ